MKVPITLKASSDNATLIDAQLYVETGNAPYVKLTYGEFDSGIIHGTFVYQAMQNLHLVLDQKGIKLLCNCFRYDVRPSGMSIDMGGGIRAYKMRMGEAASETVNIFDSTDDINSIVSLEEQKSFFLKWLESK
jgi:hypothetical protein